MPNQFSITELYNTNREIVKELDMYFLDGCFSAGLFDIQKFEIKTELFTEVEQRKKRWDLRGLREYSRENEYILESLWHLIQIIKQSGLEVVNSGNSIPHYERAYVPAWELMISPSTQNISGIYAYS